VNANIIKDEILALREEGATIIFSTHRMESVEELCDHIALIHKSNKLIEGRLDDVKRQSKPIALRWASHLIMWKV
jgi:ABC-2 type transport system ATP-binding protein